MISQELLEILVCPENHTPVSIADDALVARVNGAIASGTLKNRGGEAVTEPVDGGLVREDRAWFYPIREDIPVMLVDEALPLEGLSG
ncbi:MAG: hypothetical protein GX580_08690 [Candidatus Hydrogenedens sp.]|nr:hypothetical protein [Candidatus Hydrogenedentota bacterium]NLF57702.1 hypothetical protein [Candidatus Hydrogenedens sp.]